MNLAGGALILLIVLGWATASFAACEGVAGANPRMWCLSEEVKRLDKIVNATYRKASQKVESPDLLKQDQDFWRDTRDSDCRATSPTGEQWEECRVRSTQERLEQLNSVLSATCAPSSRFCVRLKAR